MSPRVSIEDNYLPPISGRRN